jgi:hypothetical protein
MLFQRGENSNHHTSAALVLFPFLSSSEKYTKTIVHIIESNCPL